MPNYSANKAHNTINPLVDAKFLLQTGGAPACHAIPKTVQR